MQTTPNLGLEQPDPATDSVDASINAIGYNAGILDDVVVAFGVAVGDLVFSARRSKSLYLLADGSAVSRTTYSDLFEAIVPDLGAVTVTIASPGVVTLSDHGLHDGEKVFLTTTGALPTGLSANTIYYVVAATTDTFELSATRGGDAIDTTGSQTGTHHVFFCPYGLGDGSTTFDLPNLIGRTPMGTDPTDSSTAPGHTAHYAGDVIGEEAHTLLAAESGVNGNGSTGDDSPDHTHDVYLGDTGSFSSIGGSVINRTGSTPVPTSGALSRHTHDLTARDADSAHNNLQPSTFGYWFIYAGA
ncbi:MAG TPA: hypothetical protein VHB30_12730 [Solirubrobacteraceae bacterium]|jgi:microcystin-dependent protein|nr:hypothetical protein [Solirubrobacteraceae bacterium]